MEPACVRLQLTTTAPAAACPRCAEPSSSVHSRYQRHLMDLPWGPLAVRIRLYGAQIRLPDSDLHAPHLHGAYARARGSLCAQDPSADRGTAGDWHGSRRAGGARLAYRLGLPTSRDTLWRLVRRLPLPGIPPLGAIGVDDWAHRKRQRYGTIVVDLERRQPVALLHDREANTLATWLRGHPEITVIARDRLKAYQDGARAGAPQATQVADRFHLLQNLAEALDQVFSAHGPALKAVSDARNRTPITQPDGRTAMPVPPSTPTPQAQIRAAQRRARRLATYTQVWTLHHQGWLPRLIAQHLGIGRMTVVRYLQAPTFPERKGRSEMRQSLLTPYTAEILTRWNAGCREARQLFQAIQRQGYPGATPPWRVMSSVCAKRKG